MGRESGDDAFSLLLTTAVADDEWFVAEVEDHHEPGAGLSQPRRGHSLDR
jgi:hypothetical protein